MNTLKQFIEQNPSINITVNSKDLQTFAKQIALETAKEIIEKKEEKVYTRQEVIDIFKIAPATLWRWEKSGIIKGRKLGNRLFYSESQINELMKKKS